MVSGCFSNPEERLSSRLDRFMKLLPDSERALVDAGRYADAARSLEKRLQADKELDREYREIQDDENILFFDVERTLRFFCGSMRERTKLLRFVALLDGQELSMFNQGQMAEGARLLARRMQDKSGLAATYREKIKPSRIGAAADELARLVVVDGIARPYGELSAAMTADERDVLARGDAVKACRLLAARQGTAPVVQAAHARIRDLVPETRTEELPVAVFDKAAWPATNAALRKGVEDVLPFLAGDAGAWQTNGRALALVDALVKLAPRATEEQLLAKSLQRDFQWFSDLVQEKIDFYK